MEKLNKYLYNINLEYIILYMSLINNKDSGKENVLIQSI